MNTKEIMCGGLGLPTRADLDDGATAWNRNRVAWIMDEWRAVGAMFEVGAGRTRRAWSVWSHTFR